MTEPAPATAPAMNFCPQCGTRLPPDARFCAGCGRPVASLLAPSPAPRPRSGTSAAAPAAPPARGWREQLPGLTVLAVFLAVGLGIWVTILRQGAPTSAAPGRRAPAAEAGALPPGHPPTTLPDEAKKFVASMEAKAKAAPKDVAAWKSLAQVQARAGEIDSTYDAAALDSYKHVLELAPDDEDAIRGLGNVYYDQQQYTAAAEQYERYLAKHPDDPGVRTDLATTYLYQRQFDKAVDTYQSVIKQHPDFLQAHFNLGLAYEAMGKRDQALASLAAARKLATDDTTRGQIDRVVGQLKGEPGMAAAAPDGAAGAPPFAGSAGGAPGAAPPAAPAADAATGGASAAASATDFKSAVEAALRGHPIIGPKITAIAWPAPTQARVSLADFPMQAMPDFARNLLTARLETILDDAKTRFGTTGETSIELVDASTGATLTRATH